MQSLYWVLTWACHRKCKHCYDDRFRPYVRDALTDVVGEGQRAFEAIIKNLPDDMTWLDKKTGKRERTLLVMAGGELLIDGVRDELFFPALEALKAKYGAGMPKISIQTTGDIMTEELLDRLLDGGVNSIAISSIDDYHVGMTGQKKFKFMADIRAMMTSRGVREVSLGGEKDERLKAPDLDSKSKSNAPTFLFFGAQPDLWIGELWPRGRAFTNGLSEAAYDTNFCARWSGGLNFLKIGEAGSEVSIEPNGNVYPCCLKTKSPIGNLSEETLEEIFDSVATLPAIQALNRGAPDQMGQIHGWDAATFRKKSAKEDGKGRIVENMCLGCDAYFEEHLGAQLRALQETRRAARLGLAKSAQPKRTTLKI